MAETLQNVREQYEDLPYPPRNPEDDRKRLVSIVADSPDLLNHICFGGTRDFSKPFSILVAGGGTGDSTVFLSHVFRNHPQVKITYLDFSSASRKVAEQRIKIRGLDSPKIKFITDSILNIPNLGLGKFDLIQCSGVLHHLADPEAGLKALAGVLADDGVMSIMLYATYGRFSIYPMQDIMRRINKGEQNRAQKIQNTIDTLSSLPKENNFFNSLKSFPDTNSKEGIYDLFLHDQDRAYTVPETYDFAKSADLKIIEFFTGYKLGKRDFLQPENYVKIPGLLKKIKALPLPEQYAITEVLNSRIIKQQFFAAKNPVPEIELGLDTIPSYAMLVPTGLNVQLADILKTAGMKTISCNFQNINLQITNTENLSEILRNINGEMSLRDIFGKIIAANSKLSADELLKEFRPAYELLNNNYLLFLRKTGLPGFKTIFE